MPNESELKTSSDGVFKGEFSAELGAVLKAAARGSTTEIDSEVAVSTTFVSYPDITSN